MRGRGYHQHLLRAGDDVSVGDDVAVRVDDGARPHAALASDDVRVSATRVADGTIAGDEHLHDAEGDRCRERLDRGVEVMQRLDVRRGNEGLRVERQSRRCEEHADETPQRETHDPIVSGELGAVLQSQHQTPRRIPCDRCRPDRGLRRRADQPVARGRRCDVLRQRGEPLPGDGEPGGSHALDRSRRVGRYSAQIDGNAATPHQHFEQTNGGGIALAETELLDWTSSSFDAALQQGLQQMWDEGPTGEHYQILVGPYSRIGCGFSSGGNGVTIAQDYN